MRLVRFWSILKFLVRPRRSRSIWPLAFGRVHVRRRIHPLFTRQQNFCIFQKFELIFATSGRADGRVGEVALALEDSLPDTQRSTLKDQLMSLRSRWCCSAACQRRVQSMRCGISISVALQNELSTFTQPGKAHLNSEGGSISSADLLVLTG